MSILPLDVSDKYWVYEDSKYDAYCFNVGKWMLFYTKDTFNDAWILAKRMYLNNLLPGVICMKCSTAAKNERAGVSEDGIIIFYCSDSFNEEHIITIGKNIIRQMNYDQHLYVYYKTDKQTYEGTFATGIKKNSTYKLCITDSVLIGKCLID